MIKLFGVDIQFKKMDKIGKKIQFIGIIIGAIIAICGIVVGFVIIKDNIRSDYYTDRKRFDDDGYYGLIPLLLSVPVGYVTTLFVGAFGKITEASEHYLSDCNEESEQFSPDNDGGNGLNVCPECYEDNSPTATRCASCGARLNPLNSETKVTCPYCGKLTKTNAKFCIYCGTELKSDE